MAYIYDVVKTAIQVAADATGDVLKQLALGDPSGTALVYPPAGYRYAETREPGQLWSEYKFPAILSVLGDAMDRYSPAFGIISTNATGVDPTLVAGSHIASSAIVPYPSKNEGVQSLTVTFEPTFTGANDYVVACHLNDVTGVIPSWYEFSRTASSITIQFTNTAGVLQSINDRTVQILALGTV